MEGTPNGDDDSSHTPTRANEGMNDSDQTLNTAGNEEVRERNQDNDVAILDITASMRMFLFPVDPADMANLPTNRDENSHLQSLQTSLTGKKLAHKPPIDALQFTSAIFPKAVIPYKDLMGNLDDNIKEVIEGNPKNYRAIVPFGTGSKFNREKGASTKKEYTDFLISLGFDGNSFDIAQATPKSNTSCSNDFDKPWIWILECNTREMWTFNRSSPLW